MATTLVIVGGVLVITVILGVLLALLLDQPMGTGDCPHPRDCPFLCYANGFWPGLEKHVHGPGEWFFRASLARFRGRADPMAQSGLIAIADHDHQLAMAAFATLILLTAIQSLDSEQHEAAEMDGAGPFGRFCFIILPHLARAITVVVLIQTIFLLSIFAEIFVTTAGAFGTKTLTYLIFQRVLESQNVGLGSAGGVYAIILANIVAIFLMRIVGKNLDR